MTLRVVACAAPQFIEGDVGEKALSSSDPASLYNACRYAASLAAQGRGAWGDSNWGGGREQRRETTLLLWSLPEARQRMQRALVRVRPNLVLIGAMTICLRGAIETAEMVRAALGDSVCIVLGGRHATETVYAGRKPGKVAHHVSSPLRLMAEEEIPEEVFDVVVSGDGEYVIARLGELVSSLDERGMPARSARLHLDALTDCPGTWIAGSVSGGSVAVVSGGNVPIDYHSMPSPSAMFGITAAFDVFGGAPTAHVFSDIGYGCIYDCAFCSERISVVGAPRQMRSSGTRLHAQLSSARRVVDEDHAPGSDASAFVEDSTLLGWNARLVSQFEQCMEAEPVRIRLGGQATIDQIVRSPDLAHRMSALGLEYLFMGLETPLPDVVGGLHKNIGGKNGTWMERADRALTILADAGITVGLSLLFGLGEGRYERDLLFTELAEWRRQDMFGAISMNWATQHPLRDSVVAPEYRYLDWAVGRGPMLPLLRHFGESSECYPVAGGSTPGMSEVRDIITATDIVSRRRRAS
ncbi:B12-binding domain/radical SAM domain-containing protein [Actinophytocola algeriensis]|uniref:B12-binding domain/radical SAM domain protein n=1 Tax=Actinophytocola algeriensis TaxID=1768010 RepID=A0A7W7Q3D3_9PSEU|nr:B12-binding domain/radical SAM domain-containing protein [Actinophytocola algeriensis]MBB4906204.1 B12-binding domain/radical SAM domain protein [Actinophytocola algeriensis]MBE1472111.1 B12-binding domain/radical SAM domain protein [Actinophytocola algeriensis]